MLLDAPTGCPWDLVPAPNATTAAQAAELNNILWRATNSVDRIAGQTLRSTLTVEQVPGPDYRLTVSASGVARAMLSRWPITQVLGAQCAPRVPPYSWAPIPAASVVPEEPP